jgi:hypothetical protein
MLELLADNNIAVRTAAIDALAPHLDEPAIREALEQAREVEVTDHLQGRIEALLADDGRRTTDDR